MPHPSRSLSRSSLKTVSIVAAFASAVLNLLCAVRVIASAGSLKWDLESEGDSLNVDATKLLWFLLAIYFAAAATASVIGFIGIARVRAFHIFLIFLCLTSFISQNKLSYVRFFRDYSIAELSFIFVSAISISYASFSSSSTLQASVCEEMGRQPDLLRDLAESGLNLENCEYWFGRAAVAILGVTLVFAVVRVSISVSSCFPFSMFVAKRLSFCRSLALPAD
jgi:hypothetical protein